MSYRASEKTIGNDEPQIAPAIYATTPSTQDQEEFSEATSTVVAIDEDSSYLQQPQDRQYELLPPGRQSAPGTDAAIDPTSIQIVTFDEQPTGGDVTDGLQQSHHHDLDDNIQQESSPLLHQNGAAIDLSINALTTENHPYSYDFCDDEIFDGGAECHNLTWAVLFWTHIAAVVYAGTQLAPQGYMMMQSEDFDLQQLHDFMQHNFVNNDDFTGEDLDQLTHILHEFEVWRGIYPTRILWFGVTVGVVSFGLNAFKNYFIVRAHTRYFVAASLIIPGAIFGFLLMLMMSDQGILGFLFCVFVLGFLALYIRKHFWPNLSFAALNLDIAWTGIGNNLGTYCWVFAMVELTILWVVFWCYTVLGMVQYMQGTQCPDIKFDPKSKNNDTCNPSMAVLVALLFSLFWTLKYFGNTLQVYVSGVMATWCFDKDAAKGFCSSAVTSSMYRSLTFSSGPIAFGSLFQGVCKVLRWILSHSNRNRQGAGDDCRCCCFGICGLILECLSDIFGDVLDYFNQWAYCFVGINGTSYLESGKAAVNLFKDRGWTALITDRLVALVLGFGIFEGGVVTGLVAIAIERLVTWSTYRADDTDLAESYILGSVSNVPMAVFLYGFFIGCIVSGVMMNVIQGAVNTLIICWAESPETFTDNHKHWADQLTTVWSSAFPEIQNRDGRSLSDSTTSTNTSSSARYGAIGTATS